MNGPGPELDNLTQTGTDLDQSLTTIILNFLVIDGRQIDISSKVLACDGQHSFEMQISQDSVTFKLNDNERKPGYCLCMRTDLLDAVRIKSPYIITYY